jgi:hypothetical protein
MDGQFVLPYSQHYHILFLCFKLWTQKTKTWSTNGRSQILSPNWHFTLCDKHFPMQIIEHFENFVNESSCLKCSQTYIGVGLFFKYGQNVYNLLETVSTYTMLHLPSYLSLVIGVKTVFRILEIHFMLRQMVTQEDFIM